ncbi:hypothetical protein ACDI60_27290, partial [Klebsiella pneumoniae]|uniref:hypothetical protein n=1 Tax=Klebsiella pneumoniae TaxID=573 RepID=UPI00353237B1
NTISHQDADFDLVPKNKQFVKKIFTPFFVQNFHNFSDPNLCESTRNSTHHRFDNSQTGLIRNRTRYFLPLPKGWNSFLLELVSFFRAHINTYTATAQLLATR